MIEEDKSKVQENNKNDLINSNNDNNDQNNICLFKKKKKKLNNHQIRKTSTIFETQQQQLITKLNDNQDNENKISKSNQQLTTTEVKFSKRIKNNQNLLCQSTFSRINKRLKFSQEFSSEDEEDQEDQSFNKPGVSYQAQGSARQQATAEILSSLESKKPIESITNKTTSIPTDDGLYHGVSQSKHQLPKGSAKYGPIKGGPNNIRTITVVDYQPDVCKDYRETGYCGFGDTCKFLHDRSDYMHGWQLDEAFNSSRNKKLDGDSEDEEEVPFACLICRQPFTDPIVTKCKHYYCSSCAIKRFAKTPKCFACGAPTSGIFNKATRIIEKMKAKQERIRKEKEDRKRQEEGLSGIEGLEEAPQIADEEGSERSFYEDE